MVDVSPHRFRSGETPTEIWMIIFQLVLGFEPFGPDERLAYHQLSSVCSAWRRILKTSQGLCHGLSIDWGHMASDFDMEAFKARYTPWLALVRPNQPYFLVLGETWDALKDEDATSLLQYLLCEATPTPTTLDIKSSKVFEGMLSIQNTCDSVLDLNLDHPYEEFDHYDYEQLPLVAPQLKNFTTNARVTFHGPDAFFTSATLQSLILIDILGTGEDVAHLCMGLPNLRTLKVSYDENIDELSSRYIMASPFTHSALEALTLDGEYLFPLLAHLTLPALRLLDIYVWEADDQSEDAQIWNANAPAFFQRSRSSNLTVVVRGNCSHDFFAGFTSSLPPETTLVVMELVVYSDGSEGGGGEEEGAKTSAKVFDLTSVKQIVCFYRWYLYNYTEGSLLNGTMSVLAPDGTLEEEEVEPLRGQLREKGFVLELCSWRAVEEIIGRSISYITEGWMERSNN
jgi:hypothetical protein